MLTPEELEFKKNKKRVDHDLPIVLNTSQNEHAQNKLNLNADEPNSGSQSLQQTRNVSPPVQHSMNAAAAGIGAPFNIESLIHSNYQTNRLSESAAIYSMYNTHNG